MLTRQIKGFSLIEVLVTMAITSVGLLGLSSLQLQSMRATQDTGNRSQAIWLVNDLMNRIKANEIALRNDEYIKISNDEYLKCADKSNSKVCSTLTTPATLNTCNAQEMAEYDVWDTLCGTPLSEGGLQLKTSSADFIANPELKITKSDNGDIELALRWDSQTSGYDSDGNKTFSVSTDSQSMTNRQQSEYKTVFRP